MHPRRTSALRPLTLLLATLLLPKVPLPLHAQTPEPPPPEVLLQSSGFQVLVPDCPQASSSIHTIQIDDLLIDPTPRIPNPNASFRLYGPGAPHFGNARFSFPAGSGPDLQDWFASASKGKDIRKNITVHLRKSDKTPGRTYNLIDCFPVRWGAADPDAAGTIQTETLTVKIGRIEFTTRQIPTPPGPPTPAAPPTDPADSDPFAPISGFAVEIQRGRAPNPDPDTAWTSLRGGELILPLLPAPLARDLPKTSSPGHKSVGEITLRGAMTDGRKALCEWINRTVQGRDWKRNLTITEIINGADGQRPARRYTYFDCFPTRYVFPRLSLTDSSEPVPEEVTFQIIRVDPDLPPHPFALLTIPEAPIASRHALGASLADHDLDLDLVPTTGDARDLFATFVVPTRTTRELEAWMAAAAEGLAEPRTITLDLLNLRRPTGQQLVLSDCSPLSLTPLANGHVPASQITVKFLRVELK